MQKALSLALVLTGLTTVDARAQDDAVRFAPPPEWVEVSEPLPVPDDASGLMFVRRQDSITHLDRNGQSDYFGYRIRILHPNALQLGNVSIGWNPAVGSPIVHALKVYRNGDEVDVLSDNEFQVLRREDQLEYAMLSGLLTAVLQVPDLRVGDELEFALTIPSHDPTLGRDSFGLTALIPEPAPGRFALRVSWVDGQEPTVKLTPDFEALAKRGRSSIDIRVDNPPPLNPPKDAPARFGWQRVVEFSDFSAWEEVSRRFAPLYAEAAKLEAQSALKREADRIAREHQTEFARAAAALKLVQQEVRYIYVGLGAGNLTPATAEETWQRRYGDCKGKTVMLLALLQELGIEAEPVLANNAGFDDGLDERLPNPGMFDHVLVRAQIDGKQYWLDGTLPEVALPALDPVFPYRMVLPITAQGSSIERLPWRPAETPQELVLFEMDARAGFEEPARIVSTRIIRGLPALVQHAQLSPLTKPQLVNTMRHQLIGDSTWDSIEDVEWRYDLEARASILSITGMGKIDWDDDGGGRRSLTLPGGGFSPPERRLRPNEQDQDAPFAVSPDFDCRVTTIRLPEDSNQVGWTYNSTFDHTMFGARYYRTFERRGGEIRMIRGLRSEQREIDAKAARDDNERIADFDNSMARIRYDPELVRTVPQPSRPVPATYELDWSSPNVPCLGDRE